jgi:DNA-binding LytR/AlgR family response regulator
VKKRLRESLTHLEKKLNPATFLRVRRYAIVNTTRIRHAKRLDNQDSLILLNTGEQIRSSKTYYAAMKKSYYDAEDLSNGCRTSDRKPIVK